MATTFTWFKRIFVPLLFGLVLGLFSHWAKRHFFAATNQSDDGGKNDCEDHTGALPSTTVSGIRIYEPMTALTDMLLTGLALFFAHRLHHAARNVPARAKRAWAGGFIASGVAAFAGGAFHGIGPNLPPWARAALWKLTMFGTGFTSFFMLLGTVYASAQMKTRPIWLALVVLKSLVYAVYALRKTDFRYVVYDYASAMLAVLWVQLREYRRRPAARRIAQGIGVSFLAAAIQQVGINLHTHFNKNDLYHVVQAVGFWFLYRGARRLEDRR